MLVFPWGLSHLRSGRTYFFIFLRLILSICLYSKIISSFRRKMYPEKLELKVEHQAKHATCLNLDITIELVSLFIKEINFHFYCLHASPIQPYSIIIFPWFNISRVFQDSYHCVKRVRIRSYSSPHFSSVFSPNAGKWGINADQNNSEYGLFLRSVEKHT